MDDPPIEQALSQLPHFRTLDGDLIAQIGKGSRRRIYAKDEMILSQGEPCRAFFFIEKGAVRLFRPTPDGKLQVMHSLRAGQSFAEAALLNFRGYPVSGAAMEADTRMIEVGREPFLTLFRTDDRVASAMVGSLCGWLLKLVDRIDELSAASAGARLAKYLLRLPAGPEQGTTTVRLPMAKKDLAEHLSITPETLSRLLKRWKELGLVEGNGRSLALLDVDTLEAFAEGLSAPA